MARLQNTFSWSRSRSGTFASCQRRYWFQYYGSWWGWERGIDPETRRLYVLKQLQNRWMWVGSLVHDAIEQVLKEWRDGRVVDPAAVETAVIERMRNDFRSSRSGFYHQTPKTCALMEHHYPEDDVDWVEARDHVSLCLKYFWESPYPEIARTLPREDWLAVEDMTHFEFEGTKVWAIPDFAFRDANGTIWIIDWKTGRKMGEPDPVQLACYALFGSQQWGVPPESIRTVEYHLAHGNGHEDRVDEERLQIVRTRMRQSISEMKSLLINPENNEASKNDFPPTDDAPSCSRCPFKEVCYGETWSSLPENAQFQEDQNPS